MIMIPAAIIFQIPVAFIMIIPRRLPYDHIFFCIYTFMVLRCWVSRPRCLISGTVLGSDCRLACFPAAG